MPGVVEAQSVNSGDYRDVLKRILLALYVTNNPGWLDKTANAIRATITALPTLSTVTTVGTLTNFNSWPGDPVVRMISRQSWAQNMRSRIT